jgi:hypothetical protein
MRKIQLGSVSTGTLRTEDLLDAVVGETEHLFGPLMVNPPTLPLNCWGEMSETLRKAYNAAVAITDYDSEDAGYALDELIDALDEYAPPHMRFGAHEDDGANFGWWTTDFEGCHTVPINFGNHGENTFVDTECQLHVTVSDHGNTTVRQLGGDIIWDCV